MPKQQRKSPTNSDARSQDSAKPHLTHPRPITQRERTLIELYSHCQLEMTPQQFYAKWQVTHSELACICDRSDLTVQRWFSQGHTSRNPQPTDLRHLALMDFLLEHFEEIPEALFDLLCPRR